jgi:hypothetical protein
MTSPLGQELYRLLPEIYRSRDNPERDAGGQITRDGDLGRYLDACGAVLDLVRDHLEQRLRDSTPDECQPWLLPYFAQLLGVRLRSPDEAGRRREVASGIRWRQMKGTRASVEEVADAFLRVGVVIEEGWRRVARTPRPGAAQAVTVDFRRSARAVQTEPEHPQALRRRLDDRTLTWRHAQRQGVPRFAGSHEDVSLRTADLRRPDWRAGHAHPKRLLAYMPPPRGFFFEGQARVPWRRVGLPETAALVARHDGYFLGERFLPSLDAVEDAGGTPADATAGTLIVGLGAAPPCIDGVVRLTDRRLYRFENVAFADQVTVTAGTVVLRGAAMERLTISRLRPSPADLTAPPILDALDALVGHLSVARGLARLESVTVLEAANVERLQASDCLLPDNLVVGPGAAPSSCVRFSRLPGPLTDAERRLGNTDERPVFFPLTRCQDGHELPGLADLELSTAGVLHPSTAAAIVLGAEDGGEMGAYHGTGYLPALGGPPLESARPSARAAAFLAKLEELLPVGLLPVLIPDPRLARLPPTTRSPSDES